MYNYANWRLKLRRFSPRSEPFSEKYRDTAKEILNTTKPEDEYKLKIKLAAWNYTLHSTTILRKEPTFQDQDVCKALKEVSMYRYLSEYEDYLGKPRPGPQNEIGYTDSETIYRRTMQSI